MVVCLDLLVATQHALWDPAYLFLLPGKNYVYAWRLIYSLRYGFALSLWRYTYGFEYRTIVHECETVGVTNEQH